MHINSKKKQPRSENFVIREQNQAYKSCRRKLLVRSSTFQEFGFVELSLQYQIEEIVLSMVQIEDTFAAAIFCQMQILTKRQRFEKVLTSQCPMKRPKVLCHF